MNETITNARELIDHFLDLSHPRKESKIGVEFEKMGVFADSGKAIPYQGKRGVAAILLALSHQFGWQPIKEKDNIVALSRNNARVTLEPGGQIELSGTALDNIHQIKQEFKNHIKELNIISNPLQIKWLGVGIQPVSNLNDIEWVPKERYRNMAPYLSRHGTLSHCMMKKTASIQVNVDYFGEEDFSQKVRTALALVPLTSAIFANSPISEGSLNGFMSKRAYIWTQTDPFRCGLTGKSFFFEPSFSSYVDYALDVPMLFIVRGKQWIKVENATFKHYLREGYRGYRATWEDWKLHLSTIFTEVRIKDHIEIRNADCQRTPYALAVPALWKGILYNEEARNHALSLVKDFTWEEICWLYSIVPHKGLRTRVKGVLLLDLAKELLRIAYESLKKQGEHTGKGSDETIYLEPLLELIIDDGMCPAEVIMKNWEKNWHRQVAKLVDYNSY